MNRNINLRRLDVSFNGIDIGQITCTLVAKLLENQESNLQWLNLDQNSINNDSVIILVDSLTSTASFGGCACLKTTRIGFLSNQAGGDLLRTSNSTNNIMNKSLVARRKITWSHARGNINIGDHFIDTGAMPDILA